MDRQEQGADRSVYFTMTGGWWPLFLLVMGCYVAVKTQMSFYHFWLVLVFMALTYHGAHNAQEAHVHAHELIEIQAAKEGKPRVFDDNGVRL